MPDKPKPRKQSRNSKNFVAIEVAGSLALSTLADDTYLSVGTQATFTEDFFAISADLSGSIKALTPGEGSPSTMVVAHSDYTDVEVREGLDIGSLTGPADKIQEERSRRLIRKVGVFQSQEVNHVSLKAEGRYASSRIRTKLRFLISDGNALDIGVWNRSGAALTTGASFEFDGTLYGRWLV